MASQFDPLNIIDFDYVEFAVLDLHKASEVFLRLGFEKVAHRISLERKLTSHLYVQNQIKILLSQSSDPNDPVALYVKQHGDGVSSIAFRCEDALSVFELAVNRGAEVAEAPKTYKKDFGTVTQAAIKTLGDIRHTFISRSGTLFAEGFDDPLKSQNRGAGLERIDHITTSVGCDQRSRWVEFYQKIFGFNQWLQSPGGILRMPFKEANASDPTIQEFIDIHHGPGVQHLAFACKQIFECLPLLKKQGLRFLPNPPDYYSTLKERVPDLIEPLADLQELGIQVQSDAGNGYWLQIFTPPLTGPLAYEVIQRQGATAPSDRNLI